MPGEPGSGFVFEDKIVGGVIPREFIKPASEGMREAMDTGVLAGYPMVDLKVSIVDGTFHEVDSSELAFKMAGIFALKDAAKKSNPILLEPVMKVEVTTPEEYQGDLLGDLNRRRGKIVAIEAKDTATILSAEVPLAEMFGYATDVRTMSQGRATYTMQFLHYAEVPHSIAEKLTESQG
jgi:elongation factor G